MAWPGILSWVIGKASWAAAFFSRLPTCHSCCQAYPLQRCIFSRTASKYPQLSCFRHLIARRGKIENTRAEFTIMINVIARSGCPAESNLIITLCAFMISWWCFWSDLGVFVLISWLVGFAYFNLAGTQLWSSTGEVGWAKPPPPLSSDMDKFLSSVLGSVSVITSSPPDIANSLPAYPSRNLLSMRFNILQCLF